MFAIILAAGVGSGLGLSLPKILVELDGETRIIDNHLSALRPHFSLDRIVIVTGYRHLEVQEATLDCRHVNNLEYSTTNTAASLLLALSNVPPSDVLLINGDVVYPASAITRMLEAEGNQIGVRKCSVSDEEVKYRTCRNDRVIELSKTVECGEGEAIGINLFHSSAIPLLMEALQNCGRLDYFEAGIEKILPHVPFGVVDLTDTNAIEVDFPSDLASARDTYRNRFTPNRTLDVVSR